MGSTDPLFLDPGHDDLEAAARALERVLDLDRRAEDGLLVLYARTGNAESGYVAGDLEVNNWQGWKDLDPHQITPADLAVFDHAPLVWLLDSKAGGLEEQRRRARRVFDLIVERLGWSAILTQDFEILVATYDPERGVREFPPGTPADGTGRHIWE